jgi:hypothetical protein
MKKLLLKTLPQTVFALVCLAGANAFAQQMVTVEGVVRMDDIAENTRVGIHIIDLDGNTLAEIASTLVVGGTFSMSTAGMSTPAAGVETASPFRSGAVPLPGLQSEYRTSPEDANYARAVTKVYVDNDGSGGYNAEADTGLISIATLESGGFYVLLYVDQNTTLTGRGATVELLAGWNIFTVRPGADNSLSYTAVNRVNDIILDTFRP